MYFNILFFTLLSIPSARNRRFGGSRQSFDMYPLFCDCFCEQLATAVKTKICTCMYYNLRAKQVFAFSFLLNGRGWRSLACVVYSLSDGHACLITAPALCLIEDSLNTQFPPVSLTAWRRLNSVTMLCGAD